MFNKTKLFSLWIILFAFIGISFGVYSSIGNTKVSNVYHPVVHNNDLNFQASYDDGVVNMTWNTFTPTSSNWKYRKVVRSTSKINPVYPDDGYIKYAGDINFTSYSDINPLDWTIYYGICAITQNDAWKYRNCDWQAVTVGGWTVSVDSGSSQWRDASSWIATWKNPNSLSFSLKSAVDNLVSTLMDRLQDKMWDDSFSKKEFLDVLISKIEKTSVSYKVKPIIKYLIEQLEEKTTLFYIDSLLGI